MKNTDLEKTATQTVNKTSIKVNDNKRFSVRMLVESKTSVQPTIAVPTFISYTNTMKSIYSYTNYRDYLGDYYEEQKSRNPYFSYRYFARLAKISSPSFFKMVLAGERNLSTKTIDKITKVLKLKHNEAGYFKTLVLYNQAKSEDVRDRYFEQLTEFKPKKKFTKIEKETFEYFTNRCLVILREMVSLSDFKEDYEWLSRSLDKALSPLQVKKAINMLLRLKLLKRNSEGQLELSQGALATVPDEESLEICNYHKSVLANTKHAIVDVPADLKELSSITIPMDQALLPEVRKLMQDCQDKIVELINHRGKELFEVYQVNMQMLPVTHTRRLKQ